MFLEFLFCLILILSFVFPVLGYLPVTQLFSLLLLHILDRTLSKKRSLISTELYYLNEMAFRLSSTDSQESQKGLRDGYCLFWWDLLTIGQ